MTDPPLRPCSHNAKTINFLLDSEPGVVDGGRPDDDTSCFVGDLICTSLHHELPHGEDQRPKAFVGGCGNIEHAVAASLEVPAHHVGHRPPVGNVDLVERDQARTIHQTPVGGELGLDHVHIGEGVAFGFQRRAIDHVHEHTAPLDVAQELQSQSFSVTGSGDKPGYVGDGEDDVVGADDAEVRHQGGERIVRDLGASSGDRRDQTRLSRTRVAHESDVRDGLEFQDNVSGLARFTEQRETGCFASRGRQSRVAKSTAATACQNERLAGRHQVDDDVSVPVCHDRSAGNLDDDIVGVRTVAMRPLSGLAVRGTTVRVPVQVEQCRHRRVDDGDHVTTTTTVTAVGAAQRFELLAMHRRASITAVATLRVDHGSIHEGAHQRTPGSWHRGDPVR